MQFDRTRIAVRERSILDILDLALRVARTGAGPLVATFLIGVLPAMIANHFLLASFLTPDVTDDSDIPWLYLFYMIPLVAWEAPLVTAGMTLYLGQSLFAEKAGPATLLRAFIRTLPQMILFQVVLRAVFLPGLIAPFFPWVLLLMLVTLLILYVDWPFLNEMILLERNPLRGAKGLMTTGRRLGTLHRGVRGDLFARWMVSLFFGAILLVAVWGSLAMAHLYLLAEWEEGSVATYCVYYPLALWLVAGFFAIVRFLAYLDVRIRREGWEIELMMRAEQHRLFHFVSPVR